MKIMTETLRALVAVWITACWTPTATAQSIDPCAIVLVPHAGETDIDRRIARFQQDVREMNGSTATLERLGWAFIAKARESHDPGFYTIAEQCARCIEQRESESTDALLLRGHVLHSLHRFREAEAVGRELVERRGLPFDHGLLGDALMEQGKLHEAARSYQRMMDLRPGPHAYSRAAHLRWLTGDIDGAIAMMRLAVRAFGSPTTEPAAWANVRLAAYEAQRGDRSSASERLGEVLARRPDYAPALLLVGEMELAEGTVETAVHALSRAASLCPLPAYQWPLLEALRAAGRASEAEEVAADLRRSGPSSDARTTSLYLASERIDIDSALILAEEEARQRRDAVTLDALAWAHHAGGNITAAREFSRAAMKFGTADPRLQYHAGVIAESAGCATDARRWLRLATRQQHRLLPSERRDLSARMNRVEQP